MATGTVRIDDDRTVSGMINGVLEVAPGCRVIISGMVNGTLVIGAGAEVDVTVMVNGRIDNRGGRLTGLGMINTS